MSFGDKLKGERTEREVSLIDLHEETGLSTGYLSRIENEQQIPAPRYVEKIASGLDLEDDEVRELLEERDKLALVERFGLDPEVADIAVALNERLEPDQRAAVLEDVRERIESVTNGGA